VGIAGIEKGRRLGFVRRGAAGTPSPLVAEVFSGNNNEYSLYCEVSGSIL
jgi:hypothetical protein